MRECRECENCVTLPGWEQVRCKALKWHNCLGYEKFYSMVTIYRPSLKLIKKYGKCDSFVSM